MFCPMTSGEVTPVATWNITESGYSRDSNQFSSMLSNQVDCLQMGQTHYQFIRPLQASWHPTGSTWICRMAGLPGYSGEGTTPDLALEDLKVQVHTDFQALLRKRAFEMHEEEHAKWVRLTGVIDLFHYRTTTPVVTREIGQVSFGKVSRPFRIKWISGQNYQIDPEKVPAELMSCRTGQWIEADVKRHPVSHSIIEIVSIRKISFRLPSEAEIKAFWENVPKAEVEAQEWSW